MFKAASVGTLFFLLNTLSLNAQDMAIGEWRSHLPYGIGTSVSIGNELVYATTNLSAFTYDIEDGSLDTYTKVNSLSDIGVEFGRYDNANDAFFVVYGNSNIDIIQGNTTTNLSDILRKNIVGDKTIYNLQFYENKALISSGFGSMLLDVENYRILDTWPLGSNGQGIKVNSTLGFNDFYYAATIEGLKTAPTNDPFLGNPGSWILLDTSVGLPSGIASGLTEYNGSLFVVIEDTVYMQNNVDGQWASYYFDTLWSTTLIKGSGNHLYFIQHIDTSGEIDASRIIYFDQQGVEYELDGQSNIVRPVDISEQDGVVWIADKWTGIVRYDVVFERIEPLGAPSNSVHSITSYKGETWVAGGAVSNWQYQHSKVGAYKYVDGYWAHINRSFVPALDTVEDILEIHVDPNNSDVYMGTFGSGLVKFDGSKYSVFKQASLPETLGDPGSYRIGGMDFDSDGNLWMACYGAAEVITVKTTDDEFYSFAAPFTYNGNAAGPMVIDNAGQIWMTLPLGEGIIVYSPGDDLTSTADDAWRKLGKGEGNGNLPSSGVLSIAKDLDGEIWVGTDEGVAIFYCADNVTEPNGCDAEQVFVTVDGFDAALLETEAVTSIEIDGGNRKWFGTTNGVWLMSEDGLDEIHHFTAQNSPLLSDNIMDIAVEQQSGEVIIGTEMGIISYMGDATEGGNTHSEDVVVYPNPVHPEYSGPIAIQGLVAQADVKITDLSGNLVWEGNANGGQAIWDGNKADGRRAHSGVYMVFSTNQNGKETNVAKILLIH